MMLSARRGVTLPLRSRKKLANRTGGLRRQVVGSDRRARTYGGAGCNVMEGNPKILGNFAANCPQSSRDRWLWGLEPARILLKSRREKPERGEGDHEIWNRGGAIRMMVYRRPLACH